LGGRKVRKRILNRLIADEKGQALMMVLVLILLGGLIIAPMLSYMSTGIKAGKEVYENKMYELYAADAGIEDALWYLQSDERLKEIDPGYVPGDPDWTVDDIVWPLEYQFGDPINDKEVKVDINRIWILKDLLDLPDEMPEEGDSEYGNDHWTLIGALNTDVVPMNNYVVDITTDEDGLVLVDHIGVWMPQGYAYADNGSVEINGVAFRDPDDEIPHRGGTALIWDFSGTTFKDLSDISPPPGEGQTPAEKFPPSMRLSFDYTITPFSEARGFFPWIKLDDDRIAWDTQAGLYHIESQAAFDLETEEGTKVEAYVPRAPRRYTTGSGGASSAIRGDYIAIGNSLMTNSWQQRRWERVGGQYRWVYYYPAPPWSYTDTQTNCRGTFFSESSATINNDAVPDDAQIQKAYLYWTAWWTTNGADTQVTLKVNGVPITPKEVDGVPVGPAGTVLRDRQYVLSTSGSNGYQYACFANVTNQVKAITTDVNGTEFTVGGVDAVPATRGDGTLVNQSTNAGWSMIIIYSSAELDSHQIYLYDKLAYLWNYYGASAEFTILGFEVPEGDSDAKLAIFAAEGDAWISPDHVKFRGEDTGWHYLGDNGTYPSTSDPNPWNNVFNGYSSSPGFTPGELVGQPAGEISGVDIDIYTEDRYGNPLSDYVDEGDTSASIKIETVGHGSGCDGIMLTYVVFSVRSTLVPAGEEFEVGTMTYEIK
jgi:hypothetical protein